MKRTPNWTLTVITINLILYLLISPNLQSINLSQLIIAEMFALTVGYNMCASSNYEDDQVEHGEVSK